MNQELKIHKFDPLYVYDLTRVTKIQALKYLTAIFMKGEILALPNPKVRLDVDQGKIHILYANQQISYTPKRQIMGSLKKTIDGTHIHPQKSTGEKEPSSCIFTSQDRVEM